MYEIYPHLKAQIAHKIYTERDIMKILVYEWVRLDYFSVFVMEVQSRLV